METFERDGRDAAQSGKEAFERSGKAREIWKRKDDLRRFLTVVFDLEQRRDFGLARWRTELVARLGWEDVPKVTVGLCIRNLERMGYIDEWIGERNRKLGFVLGNLGAKELGFNAVPPSVPITPELSAPPPMTIDGLIGDVDYLMEMSNLARRAKQLMADRSDLMAEIAKVESQLDDVIADARRLEESRAT